MSDTRQSKIRYVNPNEIATPECRTRQDTVTVSNDPTYYPLPVLEPDDGKEIHSRETR